MSESNEGMHTEEDPDMYQQMPSKNPSEPMAWDHQRQRTLETDQATTSKRLIPPKTLEMSWTRPPKANDLYHTSSPDLGLTGKEKARPTKKHLAQRPGAEAKRRDWPRIGMPGEPLWAAYAPVGAKGNYGDDDEVGGKQSRIPPSLSLSFI